MDQYIELVRELDLLDGVGFDVIFIDEDVQCFGNREFGYEGGDWVNGLIKNNVFMYQYNFSVFGGMDNI